jgi:hypothetical protein
MFPEFLEKEKQLIPQFSEMVKTYLKWGEANKTDSRNDENRYENHLKGSLGKKKLNDISSFDPEKLKSDKEGSCSWYCKALSCPSQGPL